MKSIIHDEDEGCYVCTHNLVKRPYSPSSDYFRYEIHHCIHGTANRRLSEKYGLRVKLCREHHTGNTGVHKNAVLDDLLKEIAQRKFEEAHSREDFRRIFGKSYL
jgi:hypothetical protein